jgi:hypothetical protein
MQSVNSNHFSGPNRRASILASPVAVAGLVVLIANDHFFKSHYPSALTGKLSDLVGLFIFPLFLSVFVPGKKAIVYVVTGIAFLVWKLPIADAPISVLNSILPFTIGRTIDYSDYWALLALPVSYFYIPKRSMWDSRLANLTVVVISCFAFCATAGTHGHIKFYYYSTSKYQLQRYIDSTFVRYPEIQIPKNDSTYSRTTDPYFNCNLVDEYGAEIYSVRYFQDDGYWRSHPDSSAIFIVAVGKYGHPMHINDQLSDDEKARVIKKFERCFVARLDDYIAPSPTDDDE